MLKIFALLLVVGLQFTAVQPATSVAAEQSLAIGTTWPNFAGEKRGEAVEALFTEEGRPVGAHSTVKASPERRDSQAHILSAAETLSIRIEGYPELSREYRIGADDAISLPVIGRIGVSEMTAGDLESLLNEKITLHSKRTAYVTVEVVTYKPVYITGHVSKPGAFAWRPGLVAAHLVALAGGRPTLSEAENQLALLKKAVAAQTRALAKLARIKAEMQGATRIDPPGGLIELAGSDQVKELIGSETSALLSRTASLNAKRAELTKAMDIANEELRGLTGSAKSLASRLDNRRIFEEHISRLFETGRVTQVRLMEGQSSLADLEDKRTRLEIEIARVRGTIARLQQEQASTEFDVAAKLDLELIDVSREVAANAIDIQLARSSYKRQMGRDAPSAGAVDLIEAEPSITYSILRKVSDTMEVVRADQFTPLLPGDLVTVSTQ